MHEKICVTLTLRKHQKYLTRTESVHNGKKVHLEKNCLIVTVTQFFSLRLVYPSKQSLLIY